MVASIKAIGGTGAARRAEVAVALGLAAGPVVALGFTRFAYALLLPPMRAALGWSFAAAGGINTANALGYVVGCLSATWWSRRFGIRIVFAASIAVSALTLLASAASGNYALLAALRAVGGVATAITFVLGSALAARVHAGCDPRRSAFLVAVYMTGVGIGIAVSGVLVPFGLDFGHDDGWRVGWLVMGVLSLLAIVPAFVSSRRIPEPVPGLEVSDRPSLGLLAPTFIWYLLFGAGYIAYLTFVVALLAARGFGIRPQAIFFVVLGVASALGTLTIWGPLAGRLPRGRGPAACSGVVLVGVLPVLVWPGRLEAALVAAVIFGSSFMAGPTAATVIARRSLPQSWLTLGVALLTTAFSAGQAVGPLVAGLLSDRSGGITTGLWLAVVLLTVSVPLALLQREH